MAQSILDQFFEEFHFKTSNKISYGIFKNRLVSLTNVDGIIKISIIMSKNINPELIDEISRKVFPLVEKYSSIIKIEYGTFSLEAYLNPTKTTDNDIISCIIDLTHILDDYNVPSCDTCPVCNRTLSSDAPFYVFEDYVLQTHEECFAPIQNMLDSVVKTKYGDPKKQSYWTGSLGVCLAGILGVVLYLFYNSLSYFACIATLIMVFMANFFYRKFNGKMDRKRVFIIASILEIFVLIGEYFFLAYSVYQQFNVSFGFALTHPFYDASALSIIVRICLNSLFVYGSFHFSLKQQNEIPTIKKV